MYAWLESGIAADPGRVHTEGREVRAVLENGRDQIAEFFGVRPRQVVLTSGATEAINSAVVGMLRSDPGPVACAAVEHSTVRDASSRCGPVILVAADARGRIEEAAVADAIEESRQSLGRPPALAHCQWANHEVGTVHPVGDVVELCRRQGIAVHVDAAAAAGHLPMDLDDLGADLVSVSAHKLGGPAGIGALIVRRGLRIPPLLVGGDQERARRAGMENVLAAVGFGAAAEALGGGALQKEEVTARSFAKRVVETATALRDVTVYGDPDHHLPHIVCLGIGGVEAEPVLLGLDQAGIAVHSGSSCSSESLAPSPVLAAMGVDAERSLRVSVGWSTTEADIEAFGAAFPRVVAEMRALR